MHEVHLCISHAPTFCCKETAVGQYCDSNKLERNWFHWLLSSSVPDLEYLRLRRLLYTKVIGTAKDGDGNVIIKHGKTLPDAMHPSRLHCIATSNPILFTTEDGIVPEMGMLVNGDTKSKVKLPIEEECDLLSDSDIHGFDGNIFKQYDEVIPKLIEDGYIMELPTTVTWHLMLEDINRMCQGIAIKFNLPTEEEHLDFSNEALLQVMNKLKNRKLVYTPGRAPVFNLLTTTIHRCMFSIMNRRKTQKNGLYKLMDEMKSGSLPDSHRSFRIQTSHNHKSIKSR